MRILTNKKFNLIINILIVFICILMLIFFKARTFEKVLIIMILILKLLSVFDFFKNKRMEEKQEVKKQGGNTMLLSEAWELYYADKTIERYSAATLKGYKIQMQLLIIRQLSEDGELVAEIDIPDETEHTGYPDDLIIY